MFKGSGVAIVTPFNEDYSIDSTQKSNLEINSVKINSATTIPAENNTLFIEGQIFYKSDK